MRRWRLSGRRVRSLNFTVLSVMNTPDLIYVITFWTIFLASCGLIAAIAHRYVSSVAGAILLTAIVVVSIFVCVNTLRLGYFDGWLIIAGPIAAVFAAVVSALVGAFMDRRGFSGRVRSRVHDA
jgi:hypothetical protein